MYFSRRLFVVILSFVLALLLGISATGAQEETVKIGLVSPFSGPIGFLGQWMANSAQVEVDRINANGGLLGAKVELITRDDEANPARSVEIVREFIQRERVSLIIGPSFSSNALAVKDLIEASGTLALFPTVGARELLEGEPTYLFRAQESTLLTASELMRYAQAAGLNKVAIFSPDDAFGRDYDSLFTELAADYELDYLGAEFFRADDQDLSAYALRVNQLGADAIVIPTGNSTLAGRALVALDATGSEAQILGISGLQGYTFAELAGDAVIGSVFVSVYLGYPSGVPFEEMPPGYAEHVQRVIEAYGVIEGASLNTYPGTALAGSAVQIWERAVLAAESFDADAVAEAMSTLNIPAEESFSGTEVAFSPDSHEAYGEGSMYFYSWYKREDGTYGFEEVPLPGTEEE